MAKYQEYTSIVLKDGRRGAIVEVFEPDGYLVDIGTSPKDWDTIAVKEADIERLSTEEEDEADFEKSIREQVEMGILPANLIKPDGTVDFQAVKAL